MMLRLRFFPQEIVVCCGLIRAWDQRCAVSICWRQQIVRIQRCCWGLFAAPRDRRVTNAIQNRTARAFLRGKNGQSNRRDNKADRQQPSHFGQSCRRCPARHGTTAATAHTKPTTLRALQQHNADQSQCKKKVDDKDDVFHMTRGAFSDFELVAGYLGIFHAGGKHEPAMDSAAISGQHKVMPHDDPDHPHSLLPPDPALRVKALETILTQKGLIDPAALDEIIETYQSKVGPRNGAHVVAKAWTDPDFAAALHEDATAAVSGLGYTGRQGEHVVALFNTPMQHNMVVCTLCSCYPWSLLGIPPGWYKSDAYRARAVREPRKVLAEFGVTLPDATSVRVWDSTAEMRYLVIPMRPKGADNMDEASLAALVTRDSMIGTGLVQVSP